MWLLAELLLLLFRLVPRRWIVLTWPALWLFRFAFALAWLLLLLLLLFASSSAEDRCELFREEPESEADSVSRASKSMLESSSLRESFTLRVVILCWEEGGRRKNPGEWTRRSLLAFGVYLTYVFDLSELGYRGLRPYYLLCTHSLQFLCAEKKLMSRD